MKPNEKPMSYADETQAKDYDHLELAVVDSVRFGIDDRAHEWPTLLLGFDMMCTGVALSFRGDELTRVLKESDCEDVATLLGRPCVLHTPGLGHTCRFVRWKKKPKA